ncbi:MAG: histone deacetylase [Verrucomicrobia bacterium]|nr:histone deacetylase [Verrucomicrobiota bacterium]
MDNANARKLPATGLVQSPLYQNHDTGTGHPERPERTAAVQRAFAEAGLDKQLHAIEPRPAADEEILLCHTPAYLATVKRDVASGRHDLSTGDTTICARSLEIAQLATGGVLNAVDAVIAGKVRNAFCVVRPPGHHANASRGMGFCLFNSIAIAARYAQHKHKLGKVLIADWDVHHGNGTQDIFYEDGSVMVFNTHQSPWYPGTGAKDETGTGRGLGCIVNCPFPSGAGAKEIVGAFKDKLLPAAQAFKPELVLISAGFDSRRGDPLGQFQLTDDDFAELTAVMLDIAKEHAGGRLVSVLEGGYSLIGLAKATTAHVKRLTEAA